MSPLMMQLIVAFIFITIGFIAGAVISFLWGGLRKPASRAPKPAAQPAIKPIDLPPTPPPTPAPRGIELARLWRETPEGGLKVNLQGWEISGPTALKPEERETMSNLVREWLVWMGVPMGTATRAAAASSIPPAAQPPQPIQTQVGSVSGNPTNPGGETPARPVAITPPAVPAVRTKSMLEQIDEILQEQLESSGQSARGIRLVEDPRIGIILWVGAEHFAGIEACPYEDVKQLIKQAAAEWERRSTQR